MIDLKIFLSIFLALLCFSVIFFLIGVTVVNGEFESIKSRLNSMEISCSSVPVFNSTIIEIPDLNTSFYCQLRETQTLNYS